MTRRPAPSSRNMLSNRRWPSGTGRRESVRRIASSWTLLQPEWTRMPRTHELTSRPPVSDMMAVIWRRSRGARRESTGERSSADAFDGRRSRHRAPGAPAAHGGRRARQPAVRAALQPALPERHDRRRPLPRAARDGPLADPLLPRRRAVGVGRAHDRQSVDRATGCAACTATPAISPSSPPLSTRSACSRRAAAGARARWPGSAAACCCCCSCSSAAGPATCMVWDTFGAAPRARGRAHARRAARPLRADEPRVHRRAAACRARSSSSTSSRTSAFRWRWAWCSGCTSSGSRGRRCCRRGR